MKTRRIGNILFFWCFVAASLCSSRLAAENPQGEFKPEEMVCRMVVGYSIDIINNAYGTSVRAHQPQTDCYLLGTQPGVNAESLAVIIDEREDVEYCGANYYLDAAEPYQRSSAFLDAECIGTFPDLEATATLELAAVQEITEGAGVAVAVLDGGVNFDHQEFAAKSGGVHSGWDYVDGDSLADDEPGGPGSGHGTFIAGIIKSVAPSAEIYAYRVLDTLGRGNGFDIASAILKAVDDGCRVLNLSFGMIGRHEAVEDALHYAEDRDVIVVAAAGNDSTNICSVFPYPAVKTYCISVAALDTFNIRADFSNYGEKIFLCAPGTGIYSTFLDTSYAWWDGTSFSAPFVAGLAGLLCSVNPSLTWEAVHDIIGATAINIDSLNPGCEGQLGHGLIHPVAAVQMASGFICGDADGSAAVNVGDAVFLLNYIFKGGPAPFPMMAGDADANGTLNISDPVYLIAYIFQSGPSPCSP
jgi:subtilisin family serine protease